MTNDEIQELVSNNSRSESELAEINKPLSPNEEMMEKIANDDQTLSDIKMLTSSRVTDQLKVFLVSQARNELSRVIKLTKFLDRLETNYINKVDESIAMDELSLKQYGEIISVITDLLTRSNDIINGVLKDDSLMTILNTTIYSNVNSETTKTSVVANLRDARSRERVRVVLNQILNKTQEYDNLVEVENNGEEINE